MNGPLPRLTRDELLAALTLAVETRLPENEDLALRFLRGYKRCGPEAAAEFARTARKLSDAGY